MLLTKPKFLSLFVIITIRTTHPGWDSSQTSLNTFNVMIDEPMSTQHYTAKSNMITNIAENHSKNFKVKHLAAWDCDLKRNKQYNEFNLLRTKTCTNISENYREPLELRGQLIQAKQFENISVLSCKLKATFYISTCDWKILGGYKLSKKKPIVRRVYLQLTRSECQRSLNERILKYTDRIYYAKQDLLQIDLSCQNKTYCISSGRKALRGSENSVEDSCLPDSFYLKGYYYPNHVLTMEYSVEIKWVQAQFNIAKRLIRVNDHLVLPNNLSGHFFSPSIGNFHWDIINQGNLTNDHWLQISDSNIRLYEPSRNDSLLPIVFMYFQPHFSYHIRSDDEGIAFNLFEETTICMYSTCRKAYKTNLRDVFLITYSKRGQNKWPIKPIEGSQINSINNIELSSIYINEGLHFASNFSTIAKQLCQKDQRKILSNIKGYINDIIDHDKNNYKHYIKSGSVIYAVKCVERIATLRDDTTGCYDDAPIFYVNEYHQRIPAFLDPITYVIKPHSPEKECNDILPFKLNFIALDGNLEWICRTSQGWDENCKHPLTLAPMAPEYLYSLGGKTIKKNLYSNEQLNSLDILQWDKIETNIDLKEWETFLKQLKNSSHQFSITSFFNDLHSTSQDFSKIFFGHNFIMMFYRYIMPFVLLNYLINIVISVIKGISYIRRLYRVTGPSLSILPRAIITVLTTCFPAFASCSLNKRRTSHTRCKCENSDFLEEVTKAVTERERQLFLKNLQL